MNNSPLPQTPPKTKIYRQSHLTAMQIQSLNALLASCRQNEPLHLGLPGDGSLFFMACDGEAILSCLIVCKVEETLWECYALTRPDCRRKGLFAALLENLCQTAPDDTELVFLLDHQSPDALAAFSALEMELWRTEYQMEYAIPSRRKKQISSPACPFPSLQKEKFQDEESRGWLFSVALPENPSLPSANPVGRCRVYAYGNNRFYLCQVEILADFRRLGLGTWLIERVIDTLPECAQVFLQVAADNTAAVNLYKKTGFRITETLSYYLY